MILLKVRTTIALLLAAFVLVGFSGCEKKYKYAFVDANASVASKGYGDLQDRFLSYWEAMSEQDYETTYGYELPYMNFLHDKKWYLNFRAGGRRHFRVTLLSVAMMDEDIAVIKAHFKVYNTEYVSSDRWYRVNGTWYHKYFDSILPPKR